MGAGPPGLLLGGERSECAAREGAEARLPRRRGNHAPVSHAFARRRLHPRRGARLGGHPGPRPVPLIRRGHPQAPQSLSACCPVEFAKREFSWASLFTSHRAALPERTAPEPCAAQRIPPRTERIFLPSGEQHAYILND